MKNLKKKPHTRRRAASPSLAKSRKVRVKLRPETVLNLVEVRCQGDEVLESLISGHLSKLDWYGEDEYFLCREEAFELLQLSSPVHYSGRFGEAILFYSKGTGWVLKSGLETKSDPIEDYLHLRP